MGKQQCIWQPGDKVNVSLGRQAVPGLVLVSSETLGTAYVRIAVKNGLANQWLYSAPKTPVPFTALSGRDGIIPGLDVE